MATLVIAICVWHATARVPCGPQAGKSFAGPVATSPVGNTFRVATFNIHGGRGRDGRYDLQRIARQLSGYDFVGLQEVRSPKFAVGPTQVEELAAKLDVAWLFAPAVRQYYHYEFGNGALAKLPIDHWQTIPLPREYAHTYHNMLLSRAHFAKPDGRNVHVHLLVTHLQLREEREREQHLRNAIALFLALDEPVILMGDLNTRADDPQLAALLRTAGVENALAYAEDANYQGVDWIVARGLKVLRAGVEDQGASDHPLVWAEFKTP